MIAELYGQVFDALKEGLNIKTKKWSQWEERYIKLTLFEFLCQFPLALLCVLVSIVAFLAVTLMVALVTPMMLYGFLFEKLNYKIRRRFYKQKKEKQND